MACHPVPDQNSILSNLIPFTSSSTPEITFDESNYFMIIQSK